MNCSFKYCGKNEITQLKQNSNEVKNKKHNAIVKRGNWNLFLYWCYAKTCTKNKTIKYRLLQIDIFSFYQRVLNILKSTTFVRGA